MKLWRCSWIDDSEGHMLAWGTTKANAKHEAMAGGMNPNEHEPSFITYKLPLRPDALVDWLNLHVQKDNG